MAVRYVVVVVRLGYLDLMLDLENPVIPGLPPDAPTKQRAEEEGYCALLLQQPRRAAMRTTTKDLFFFPFGFFLDLISCAVKCALDMRPSPIDRSIGHHQQPTSPCVLPMR